MKCTHALKCRLLRFNALFSLNRFRASPVNDIFCQSLPGSPFKPLTLRQLEQQEEILRVPFRRNKEVWELSNSISFSASFSKFQSIYQYFNGFCSIVVVIYFPDSKLSIPILLILILFLILILLRNYFSILLHSWFHNFLFY